MELAQIAALAIFLLSVGALISGVIDSLIAALLGVVAMIVAGVMTEVEAMQVVDWNVIAILLGIWTIAGYFGKTGLPEYLAVKMLKVSGGNVALFVALIGVLGGLISMFVDNVVVVLMLSPIIFHVSKTLRFSPAAAVLYLGFCANFMGTALLLGDLPPQMLHSVSGIEFFGFIWNEGRPSSFPILIATFLGVVAIFYRRFRKVYADLRADGEAMGSLAQEDYIKDKKFAGIVIGVFLLTILGMSIRQWLGVHLGFIALTGAILLVFLFEILGKKLRLTHPFLEEILSEMDWKAIGFYIALFALVGGLEKAHIIQKLADALLPVVKQNLLLGTGILYWVTAPIVGIVEHDAYILTFLYVIRDMATSGAGLNPWPLYWALLWAGTLGSNLTIAGAPALYLALNLAQKEEGRKIPLKEFLGHSVPFVVSSLAICYLLLVLVWVLPFM